MRRCLVLGLVLTACIGSREVPATRHVRPEGENTPSVVVASAPVAPVAPEPIRELEPLPTLSGGHRPGTAFYPAVMLTLPRPKSGAELSRAYSIVYNELGGMNGWFPVARTDDGWRDFVTGRDVDSSVSIACGIDLVSAVSIDDAVRPDQLMRGCRRLHRLLGGEMGPPIDEEATLAAAEQLRQVSGTGAFSFDFQAPNGFLMSDVLTVIGALGFQRSDIGTYAWYNRQAVGHDRLIVVAPGRRPDADGRIPYLSVEINLAMLPVPELVVLRLWQVLETLRRELNVEATHGDGSNITEASFQSVMTQRISILREAGYFRDIVVVPDAAP